MDHWIEQFPNTYFGLTSMVRLFKPLNPDKIAAVCDIQPSRMLLGTDAPYFAPQGTNVRLQL
jgi:Tat protein secretion system quality control protein TatD with DNase activity